MTVPDTRLALRILCTSDLHMQLRAYDYSAMRPSRGVGLEGLAPLIDRARQEAPNCLLFDNGDTFEGSPLADLVSRGAYREGNPMVAAMNMLGYDAITLGNHDFDNGEDYLRQALREARFPVVLSNLSLQSPLAGLVQPYTLITREMVDSDGASHRITVGVAGLAPSGQDGLLDDQVGIARITAETMRKAGADITVLLFHGGLGGDRVRDGVADPCDILRAASFDALLLGHEHRLFPDPCAAAMPHCDTARGLVCGVPAVMPGIWGSHLGLIDMELRRDAGGWTVAASRSSLRANTAGRKARAQPSARAIADLAARPHRKALRHLRRPLARVDRPVHSFFAFLPGDLPSRIAAHACLDTGTGLLAEGQATGLPCLALSTSYRAGGPAGVRNFLHAADGVLCERHLADLYPFQNRLEALVVTAPAVTRLLERSAAMFGSDAGSSVSDLLTPTARSYEFDTIAGLDYTIDLSRPSGSRVTRLSHAGAAVTPDQRFVLFGNAHRLARILSLAVDGSWRLPMRDAPKVQDVIRDWLLRAGTIHSGALPAAWTLRTPPGHRLAFATHPDALSYLQDLSPFAPAPAGPAPGGFLRICIGC